MLRQIKTIFGHDLNDGTNYTAVLLNPNEMPDAKAVFVEQSEADSQDAGTFTVDVLSLAIQVMIRNQANRVALVAQLKLWCKRGTSGDLVVTYADDRLDYGKPCRVVNLVQDPIYLNVWTVVLQTGETAWKAVTAETDSWTANGTGGTKSIDVAGDDETYVSLSLTPTATPAGRYLYHQVYQLVPVSGVSYGVRPWCITLNTAALVSAGKLQADCDDLRILVGGVEVRRWIINPNNASTKIWFNVDLGVGAALTLRDAVAGSGAITFLQFLKNKATKQLLKILPKTGIIYDGTEWMAYFNPNPLNCRVRIQARAIFGTSMQAHGAGSVFKTLPPDIKILYGNATATDPALDDSNYDDSKPPFDLSASDNSNWVYDSGSIFYDPTEPARIGQWVPYISRLGDVSTVYTTVQQAGVYPSLGLLVGSWLKGATFQAEKVKLFWIFFCSIGIASVSATGQKWRNTARWPASTGFQTSADGSLWSVVWAEAKPASINTWTALGSHSGVSVSNNKWVRFNLSGAFGALADALALYEIDTVTLTFPGGNLPAGSLLGEVSNYALDVDLVNNENGDTISLFYPMRLNQPFTIDGEAFTVIYDNLSAHAAMTLDDPSRPAFLRLQPGANELQLISNDCGTLALALSWYPRRL